MNKAPDKGFALIVALIALLVLSSLAASIMFVTQTEIATTYNYKRLTQARYAAEAGLQSAMNYLIYTYTPPTVFTSFDMTKTPVQASAATVVLSAMDGVASNYPTGSVQTAFSAALLNQAVPGMGVDVSYGVTATLLSMQSTSSTPMQTWLIRSRGTIAGSAGQVELVTTIERAGTASPIYNYAAFGTAAVCDSVSFGGGGGANSYDSSGTYAATQQMSGGDLGSNGNIELSGGGGTAPLLKVIAGTLNTPKTGTGNCSDASPDALSIGSGWTVGTLNRLTAPVVYPNPAAISPMPPVTDDDIRGHCNTVTGCGCYPGGGYACTNNGPYKLAAGSYGNVDLGGGKVLHLSAGTYTFNSLQLDGNLVIDSGPVILKLAGAGISAGACCALDLSGGIANDAGLPSNLQISYGGTANIMLSGGAGAKAVLYAPNSDVSIGGGGDFYGAMIGRTVENGGGTTIHYDRALKTSLMSGAGAAYHATSFGWSSY